MFLRKPEKSSPFKGTVYLCHSPEFLKMTEFTGKWTTTEIGLFLEKGNILIPFHNIAFIKVEDNG